MLFCAHRISRAEPQPPAPIGLPTRAIAVPGLACVRAPRVSFEPGHERRKRLLRLTLMENAQAIFSAAAAPAAEMVVAAEAAAEAEGLGIV